MLQNQNIPFALIKWAIQEKKETILRDYIIFRAYAFDNGSYYRKPDEISWHNMRRLVDLGWVVRVNRSHYRFVSVYKIALSLSLNIKLSVTINSNQLIKGSANWKSYLMAKVEAFIIKRKSYVNRNGIIDRDGATNKGSINRELIATRYLQKHIGLSPSTVSRRRKYKHNNYLAQYNPHFDKLNIKRKTELMFFLDQLKYSDLNESEKELFRNIEWDSSLKKYRVRTSTKVLVKGHSLNYNNSSSSYKKRYAQNLKTSYNPL